MTIQDNGARRRAEKYRRAIEARGQSQINVWLDQSLKNRLDEFVRAGNLRNRSEAIAMAVSKLVEENRN